MIDLLEKAKTDTSLLTTYRQLKNPQEPKVTGEAVMTGYANHFVTSGPVVHAQTARFELFSLVDPNVRTVLTCTTSGADTARK